MVPDGESFYSVGNDKLIKRWSMNNFDTPSMTIVGKVNRTKLHITILDREDLLFSMYSHRLIIIIRMLSMQPVAKLFHYGMNNVHNLCNHLNGVLIVIHE